MEKNADTQQRNRKKMYLRLTPSKFFIPVSPIDNQITKIIFIGKKIHKIKATDPKIATKNSASNPIIIISILTNAPTNRAKKLKKNFFMNKSGCSPRQLENVTSLFQGKNKVWKSMPTEKKCQKNFK